MTRLPISHIHNYKPTIPAFGLAVLGAGIWRAISGNKKPAFRADSLESGCCLLFLIAPHNGQSHDGNSQANDCESQVNYVHIFYAFSCLANCMSPRLRIQNIIANTIPLISSEISNLFRTAGSTAAATNRVPISAVISESFSNCESDNLNFTNLEYRASAYLSMIS